MTVVAPTTITIEWCPVCGRTDRYQAFTGKSHYSGGDRCMGNPITVCYVRTPDGLPPQREPDGYRMGDGGTILPTSR